MENKNFINIDLHCHSNFSDGSLSVTDLIKLATYNNCRFLALTDHDTVDGVSIAIENAKNSKLMIISGVEISVTWYNNILLHILGLNVDFNSLNLINNLSNLQSFRYKRAEQIDYNLSKIGINNSLIGAMKYCKNKNAISRTHFNQFLVDNNYAKPGKAFDKFLAPGKPGYVECKWAKLSDAIEWIKNSGGVSVLAHPGRYKLSNNVLNKLISEFKSLGGDGIEIISPSHTIDDVYKLSIMSIKYNLLASCGSDFHTIDNGKRKNTPGITRCLPNNCIPIFERIGINI